jgi:hypothetical protein
MSIAGEPVIGKCDHELEPAWPDDPHDEERAAEPVRILRVRAGSTGEPMGITPVTSLQPVETA